MLSQNFWVKDNRQIYLLGNPLVWWLSTAAVLFYAAIRGLLIIRAKRGYKDFENSKPAPRPESTFCLTNSRSESGEIRHTLRIPFRRMGSSLFPLLFDGSPVVLAPLFSSAVLRHSALLRRVRSCHICFTPSRTTTDRSSPGHSSYLELCVLEPARVRPSMDQTEVQKCTVAEALGLLLVRSSYQLGGYARTDYVICSNDFHDSVSMLPVWHTII